MSRVPSADKKVTVPLRKNDSISPSKVSALSKFRTAAIGIKFTQSLNREINHDLNKEFVDLKNANDC